MSGVTWTKFYWSDWASDPALSLCSLGAQGLWMRMLCIAAQHDPIGYLSIAGRPLGVTDLAKLTGASETELEPLVGELDRNGVFSRDRLGRIYSRRMVADARKSAEYKKWGATGGNPNLGNRNEKPRRVNPPLKPTLKPQEPSASTKVRASKNALNLSGGEDADERTDGSSPPIAWNGPTTVRAAFVAALGEDWTKAYIDPSAWQDVPDRALIPATKLAGQKIVRDGRKVLAAVGLNVLEKAA